jgi:hypothetical protein
MDRHRAALYLRELCCICPYGKKFPPSYEFLRICRPSVRPSVLQSFDHAASKRRLRSPTRTFENRGAILHSSAEWQRAQYIIHEHNGCSMPRDVCSVKLLARRCSSSSSSSSSRSRSLRLARAACFHDQLSLFLIAGSLTYTLKIVWSKPNHKQRENKFYSYHLTFSISTTWFVQQT